MSRFYRALEQARRDRAFAAGPEPAAEPGAPPTAESPAAPSEQPGPAEPTPEHPGAAPPSSPLRPEPPRGLEAEEGLGEGVEEHLVSLLRPTSFEAEQYRVLCHLVEQLHRGTELGVLAVSSPTVGDGKTITAINLAGALAETSRARVLLIDADLRRSTVAEQLGLRDAGPLGLMDVILEPGVELGAVAKRRPPFNLAVVTAGHRPAVPYEVLKSPRLGEILAEARRQYDYVVLDTPPLLPVPDCRNLERWVDGFLVVVAAHRTPRKLVGEALALLDPGKLLGLVFNGDDRPLSATSYGYYGVADRASSLNGRGGGWWRWALGRRRRSGGA